MKRLFIFAAAVMLSAGPCFAAGAAHQSSTSSGPSQPGTQTNIINTTDVRDVTGIANDNSTLHIGTVENEGGNQTNVINETSVRSSTLISNDNSDLKVGSVTNKK